MLRSMSIGSLNDFRAIASFLHGLNDGLCFGFRSRCPSNGGFAGIETDQRAAHAWDALNRLGDMPGAIATTHPRYAQLGHARRGRYCCRFGILFDSLLSHAA